MSLFSVNILIFTLLCAFMQCESSYNVSKLHSIFKRSIFLPVRRRQPYIDLVAAIRRDYVVRYPSNKDSNPCDPQAPRTSAVIATDLAQVYGGKKAPCPIMNKNAEKKSSAGGSKKSPYQSGKVEEVKPTPCPRSQTSSLSSGKSSNDEQKVNEINKKVNEPAPAAAPPLPQPQPKPLPTKCEDFHEYCCFWASLGHCDSNLYWMRPNCQKACGTCGCTIEDAPSCYVTLGNCGFAKTVTIPDVITVALTQAPVTLTTTVQATTPIVTITSTNILTTTKQADNAHDCTVDLGTCGIQESVTSSLTTSTPTSIVGTEKNISSKPNPTGCEDSDALCCFWASLGQCDSNLWWMRPNCQKACGTCGCSADNAPDCKVNLGTCGIQESVTSSIATSTPPSTVGTEKNIPPKPNPNSCTDADEMCCFWASASRCDTNSYYMRRYCQKACGTCGCTAEDAVDCKVNLGSCGDVESKAPSTLLPPPPTPTHYTRSSSMKPAENGACEDTNKLCCFWAQIGHCDQNIFWMRPNCQKSCGTCGCREDADKCVQVPTECTKLVSTTLSTPEPTQPVTEQPVATLKPQPEGPSQDELFTLAPLITNPPPTTCADTNELCCFWASENQCDENLFWMRMHCAVSCGTCGCAPLNALGCHVQVSEFCQVSKEARPEISTPVPDNSVSMPGPPAQMQETAPSPVTILPPSGPGQPESNYQAPKIEQATPAPKIQEITTIIFTTSSPPAPLPPQSYQKMTPKPEGSSYSPAPIRNSYINFNKEDQYTVSPGKYGSLALQRMYDYDLTQGFRVVDGEKEGKH